MSASHWSICPRCDHRLAKAMAEADRAADAAYGKVPQAEWQKLRAAADAMTSDQQEPTLREDYEIYGADQGSVKISYGASCSTCGLSLEFKHEVVFEGVEA